MFAVLVANVACAAAQIENLVVRQQWPWNPKVVIQFDLVDGDGGVHDVALTLRDGGKVIVPAAKSLSGAVEDLAPGRHRIVWDPVVGIDETTPGLYTDFSAEVAIADDPKKWMIIDLGEGATAASYSISFSSARPSGGWLQDDYLKNKIVLRRVPACSFTMGSTNEVEYAGVCQYEYLHKCTFTKDYYLAIFPTTEAQYVKLAGALPYSADKLGDKAPVYQMSYDNLRGGSDATVASFGSNDCVLKSLSEKTEIGSALPGYRFDLPSAAQWECACRAGGSTAYYNGLTYPAPNDDYSSVHDIAYFENTGSAEVGYQRAPNAWGFYDMQGGIYELCRDIIWPESGYTNTIRNNLSVDKEGVDCVYSGGFTVAGHGGHFKSSASEVRASSWLIRANSTGTGDWNYRYGFRIACTYFE